MAEEPGDVETTPDQSAELDRAAIAQHAAKLVAAKARRDRLRFLRRYGASLSPLETIGVAAAALVVLAAVGYALLALLTWMLRSGS